MTSARVPAPLKGCVALSLGGKRPNLLTLQGNRVLRGFRTCISERVEGQSGSECTERAREAL